MCSVPSAMSIWARACLPVILGMANPFSLQFWGGFSGSCQLVWVGRLLINHPFQQVVVRVSSVEANRRQDVPLASSLAGTGPPDHLYSQICQHFLAILDGALPDETDVGAAWHRGGAPQGGGVALRMDVDFGVADLNRKDIGRTLSPFRFVVDSKGPGFYKTG